MLNELNKQFYAKNADSFSKTRANPWRGWNRLSPYFEDASTVLDIACGNLRFERFVQEHRLPPLPKFHCVDVCPELLSASPDVEFQCLDIVDLCIEGKDVAARVVAPPCDFVVSFGFFHHVPSFDARMALLKALVDKTVTGGKIALSFWQFMNDEKLAYKAEESTARLRKELCFDLNEGDYLLGWQDEKNASRYCHHFTDEEVDELVMPFEKEIEVIDCYRSDGKTVPLNTYIVLQKL